MDNSIKVLEGGIKKILYHFDLTESELGLLSDLLNSVSDLRAAGLRQEVEKVIRADNAFRLLINKKIVKCKDCKGTGSIKYSHLYYDSDEFNWQTCNNCQGEGRLVIITTIRRETVTEEWEKELTPEY